MLTHTPYPLGVCVLAAAVVEDIPAATASPKRRGCKEWKFRMKILHVYYQLFTYQLHICWPMFSCSNLYADPNFSQKYLTAIFALICSSRGMLSKRTVFNSKKSEGQFRHSRLPVSKTRLPVSKTRLSVSKPVQKPPLSSRIAPSHHATKLLAT